MEVGASVSPQASKVDNQGGGIQVTKIALDQQKADGQAAVQLIDAAAVPAIATQGISIKV
ncbi:MAG: hypothetical protein ACJAYG_000147 [Oceanicoccus sp.]|jgi:hypothetical protein